jgi:hypothetical protein
LPKGFETAQTIGCRWGVQTPLFVCSSTSSIIAGLRVFHTVCNFDPRGSFREFGILPVACVAMAVDPDAADREFIAQNMDSDLQFILSDSGV